MYTILDTLENYLENYLFTKPDPHFQACLLLLLLFLYVCEL